MEESNSIVHNFIHIDFITDKNNPGMEIKYHSDIPGLSPEKRMDEYGSLVIPQNFNQQMYLARALCTLVGLLPEFQEDLYRKIMDDIHEVTCDNNIYLAKRPQILNGELDID